MATAGVDKFPFVLHFDPGVSDADVALISSLTSYRLRCVQAVAETNAAWGLAGSAGDRPARSSWPARIFRRRDTPPAPDAERAAWRNRDRFRLEGDLDGPAAVLMARVRAATAAVSASDAIGCGLLPRLGTRAELAELEWMWVTSLVAQSRIRREPIPLFGSATMEEARLRMAEEQRFLDDVGRSTIVGVEALEAFAASVRELDDVLRRGGNLALLQRPHPVMLDLVAAARRDRVALEHVARLTAEPPDPGAGSR